jgi:hypothetical protein
VYGFAAIVLRWAANPNDPHAIESHDSSHQVEVGTSLQKVSSNKAATDLEPPRRTRPLERLLKWIGGFSPWSVALLIIALCFLVRRARRRTRGGLLALLRRGVSPRVS